MMKTQNELIHFMTAARDDPRLSPLHLSVYLALLYLDARQCNEWICVSARSIMPLARIASSGPYHRVMRQLHAYGYIKYLPSFNRRSPSKVWLIPV